MTTHAPTHLPDRAELAAKSGFTGTFRDFLSWLEASLIYGGISVTEDAHDDVTNRTVVRLTTWTGGFSSDEHLLGRLRRNPRLGYHWRSSARGGVTVYEFPVPYLTDPASHEWLAADTGVFETVGRARRVRVYDAGGDDYVEFSYPEGAELVFREEQRDIVAPDGLLVVRPLSWAP